MMVKRAQILGQDLLLGLACFAAAWIGLGWADRATATLPFWPAAGIALYGVRRLGLRSAWAVATGLLPAFVLRGVDPLPSLLIALANGASAALVALWLRRRIPQPGVGTANLALFGQLIAVIAGASLLAAVAGVAALWRPGLTAGIALRMGAGGFLGHFAGIVVVTPFLDAWLRRRRPGARPMPAAARIHLIAVLGAIALLCWPVFLSGDMSPLRTWHLYPLLIWSALAFRARGSTAAMLIVAVAAVIGTINGLGPFGVITSGIWEAILLAQQFIIITSLIIGLLAEVADERRSLEALRAARQRFDFALDAAGMVGWEYSAGHGRIRPFGDVEAFYGRPIADSGDLAQAVHPHDREAMVEAAGAALRGERDYELEYRVPLPDGTTRHVLARGRSTTRPGEPPSLSGIALDVTARRRDEERQKLLMAELDHRVKNILATIQALITRTATDKTSVPELAETLKGRVQAMARAHSMLARNRWEGASLKGLIEEELQPYGVERARLEGPEIRLVPRAALSLSLALHEFATNAAKYGALSARGGQVSVAWGTGADTLTLDWRESGGPAVAGPPSRRGFGSVMTERVIRNEFGGTLDLDYAAGGLSCRITLPLSRIGQAGVAPPAPVAKAGESPPPVSLAGRRILVVEDAPIIAEATAAQVRAAGAAVVGPFLSLGEAMASVDEGNPDAALLDVNLGDEMVFPLADRLAALGVPFAFATGYGDETILPPHLRGRPRILKPFDDAALLAALGRALAEPASP